MSDDGTSFGIFYPTNHVVAVLPTDDKAVEGHKALIEKGITEAEINLMKSSEVLAHIEEKERDQSWMTQFKEALSIGVGTEGAFWQEDQKFAKDGAGFLVIRCKSDERAEQIADSLTALKPLAMRRYLSLAIEDMMAGTPG